MFWENNSFLLSVISDIIHHFAAKFKYNSKNVEPCQRFDVFKVFFNQIISMSIEFIITSSHGTSLFVSTAAILSTTSIPSVT